MTPTKITTTNQANNGSRYQETGTPAAELGGDVPHGETSDKRGAHYPRSVRVVLPMWLLVATLLGGMSVALGAFGAHGLEKVAQSWPEADRQRRLDNWEVAARYQMYHALALAGVAFHLGLTPRRVLHVTATLFLLGIMIFSGCLYAYTLSGARFWGAIVPIGGSLLIMGWALWCWASVRLGVNPDTQGR